MSFVKTNYKLFSVFGIEIEYMIVENQSLKPFPIADEVIKILNNGYITNEVEIDDIAVSNELALHVIELKTNGPTKDLNNLDKSFLKVIHKIQKILNTFDAKLLPTGMHPFFTPDASLKLWPHSNNEIYDLYNKIFNCQGHGWGNLQSVHINLPFSNEEEFVILHEIIRLILPIIPALTASTPFVSGKTTNFADNRLLYYGKNQSMLPCISGRIIPEAVSSYQEYQDKILQPMYNSIAPYDEEGILQHEWLNSRGAIARFERNAIEIRIVDSQESALMDVACIILIVHALKDFFVKKLKTAKFKYTTEELEIIYKDCLKNGAKTIISNDNYLDFLGFNNDLNGIPEARNIWQYIYENIKESIPNEYHKVIKLHLESGNLSDRLIDDYENNNDLVKLYNKLHVCLLDNKIFRYE
tara:strand:- start:12787 stop:14025 length:1239 start_codon:yes stop_codon:yes gene_type:complete